MRANDPQRCETASTSSLLYFKVWKFFALSMVVFALVVGLLAGIGWMFDLPALTRMPGFTTMKPNTSVGVIFSALALLAALIGLAGCVHEAPVFYRIQCGRVPGELLAARLKPRWSRRNFQQIIAGGVGNQSLASF